MLVKIGIFHLTIKQTFIALHDHSSPSVKSVYPKIYFLNSQSKHILGQKRNAAFKDYKYCALKESYKISSAIYFSLLYLPHIIPIVLLSSVNPNQCTGCLFIFKFFTCTLILFSFTHVITTEITSLTSNLLENILKIKLHIDNLRCQKISMP